MNYTMEFEYIVVITYFKTIKVRYTSYLQNWLMLLDVCVTIKLSPAGYRLDPVCYQCSGAHA